MKITIVIPTYNENENITELVEKIFAQNIPDLSILFIDDNSPDGTAETIKKLQNKYRICLVQRTGKLGLGSAYLEGFRQSLALGSDYIFEMDADLSHNPKDIPRLLEACVKGADLAIGSRKISGGGIIGWNFWRHFSSNGAMFFSRLLLRLKPHDVTAGFRCFRRSILEKINLDEIKSNGYAFQEELLYKTQKVGFNIIEVPVIFNDRKKGKSKLSKKDIWEFFLIIFKLRYGKNKKTTTSHC